MFFSAIASLITNIQLVNALAAVNEVEVLDENLLNKEEAGMNELITTDIKDQVLASYEAVTPISSLINRTLLNDWRNWDKELAGYQTQYGNSPMLAMMPKLHIGKPDGIQVSRIGSTGKLRFVITDRKAPAYNLVYGGFKVQDADLVMGIDVPMAWMQRQQFEALVKRVRLVKKEDERWVYLPPVSALAKLMFLAKDRETFTAVLETLTRYPTYNIDVTQRDCKPSIVDDYAERQYDYLLKDEHVLKGFYAVKGTDSVYGWYQDGGFYGMEAPKKSSARMRLVMTPDTTPIGDRDFFVMEDVPVGLKPLFVQGNGYAPVEVLERLGVMRWVNESLKCTTMPHLAGWDAALGDETLVAKSGWKGGLNGVVKQLTGKSVAEISAMDKADRDIVLEFHKSERAIPFNGTTYYVKGWHVVAPVNVSNFFVLHGLRSVDAEEGDMINEELVTDRSFYLEALSNIRSNPEFDLIGAINDRIQGGVLRYAGHLMQVKLQEMVNVGFSYGREIRDQFIAKVLEQSAQYMRASTKEALNLQTGSVDAETYDFAQLTRIRAIIFDGMRVPVGSFDPNHPQYAAQGVANPHDRLNWLLYGFSNNQVSWGGLLVGGPKKVMVGDKPFYLPSGETMKQFVFDENGSSRKFFSGPAQAFLLLLVAMSHKNTDWNLKHIAHQVDLQSSLLGENMDNFTVRGTHKLILPGFWLNQDEVACVDKGGFIKHNNRVVFSKMPVLFNKAVSDQMMKTYLPKKFFGEVSDRLIFALSPAVFVSNQLLLDHQNDCDGDLGRIMDLGGVCPLYTGLPDYMRAWADKYAKGEFSLFMEWKDYEFYDKNAITAAVHECAENKEYIGRGSNDVFALSHWLEFVSAKGFITHEEAQKMRDAYVMQFQDDIVRGLKHPSNGGFKAMSFSEMFTENDAKKRTAAQAAFMNTITAQVGVNMDAHVVLVMETLREKCDPQFLLAARRQRSITKIRLDTCHVENTFKVLDMVTNSYLGAVDANKPVYGHSRSTNKKVLAAFNAVMADLPSYAAKYILLGQDLSAQQSVTLGTLLKLWKQNYREEAAKSLIAAAPVVEAEESVVNATVEQAVIEATEGDIPWMTFTGLEGIVPPSLLK